MKVTTPPKRLLACGSERISQISFRENSSSLISWITLVRHCGSALHSRGRVVVALTWVWAASPRAEGLIGAVLSYGLLDIRSK